MPWYHVVTVVVVVEKKKKKQNSKITSIVCAQHTVLPVMLAS